MEAGGCELTLETFPISVANPQPKLHSKVLNIFFNVHMGVMYDI